MANTKVTGDVIANGTISTVHLADDAITAAKLDSTATGITFADLTVDTDTLYVDAANNRVGIGTTSPHNDVGGLSISVASSTDQLYLERTGSGTGRYYLGTSNNSFYIVDDTQSVTRMVIDSSGNVGIGTASPSQKLHVVGKALITDDVQLTGSSPRIDFNSNGSSPLRFYDTTNAAERMRIDTSGNIGIGTTSPNSNLQVVGSAQDQIRFGTNTSVYTDLWMGTGYTVFDSIGGSSGAFDFRDDGSSRMFIDSSGNVGIGRTDPNARLDIKGAGGGTGLTFETSDASNNQTFYIQDGGRAGLKYWPFTIAMDSGTSHATGARFQVATTSGDFVILNDGKTGIGTTTPFSTAPNNIGLNVDFGGHSSILIGDGVNDGGMIQSSDNVQRIIIGANAYDSPTGSWSRFTADSAALIDVYGEGSSAFISFNVDNGTSGFPANRMHITNTGNVGIGVTDPQAKLEVMGSSATPADGNETISVTNTTGGTKLLLGTVENSYGWVQAAEGGTGRNLLLNPNGGNVGIGTTSPGTKLDIVGTSSGSITNLMRIQNPVNSAGTGHGASLILHSTIDSNRGVAIASSSATNYATNNNMLFYTSSSSTLYERMRIDSNGQVGIGNTSPNATLEIGTPGGAFAGSPGSVNRLFIAPYSNTGGPYKFIARTVSGSSDFLDMYYGSNHIISYSLDGKIGIGTTSPAEKLTIDGTVSGAYVRISNAGSGDVSSGYMIYNGSNLDFNVYTNPTFGNTTLLTRETLAIRAGGSERMRITSGGKTLIGMTSEQNAGKVQIDSGASENGGILDIASSGWYRYYTRVCRNSTSAQQAGYWHIKTNIVANSNTMFLAKFYGYIYGSAQILDLTHAGYAYSGSGTVINQATTNNGSNVNASSAVYVSANGSKVTFRIAFGSGSTFSTYFAGVFMDIAFPSPAGQGHDFEIEAQSFSTNTTVY